MINGERWKSVEHFYQASKFNDGLHKSLVKNAISPSSAKEIAWSISDTVPIDWAVRGPETMLLGLRAKFEQPVVDRRILLGTSPFPILEDSHDENWGIGVTGRGENMLGKLLDRVRSDNSAMARSYSTFKLKERPAHRARSRFQVIEGELCYDENVQFRKITELDAKAFQQSIPILISQIKEQRGGDSPVTLEDRSQAFEAKYVDYLWSHDARSLCPEWGRTVSRFLVEDLKIRSKKTIVLGAGAGQEAYYLWRNLEGDMVLCDVSAKLRQNIERQAPNHHATICFAENLSHFPNNSFDNYVAFRVFQSYGLDLQKSVQEAVRVTKSDGKIAISIANGYISKSGELIQGQVSADGNVSQLPVIEVCSKIAEVFSEQNFELVQMEDWVSEILMVFSLPDL